MRAWARKRPLRRSVLDFRSWRPGALVTAQGGGRGERIADAKPGDVRVLATAAIRIPLDAVRAEAAKAIGHPLVIEYGSARGNLKDSVMAGNAFEVALLLPDVDEQLLKASKIRLRVSSLRRRTSRSGCGATRRPI